MNKKIIGIAAVLTATLFASGVLADTSDVTASMTIGGLCGMDVSTNDVTFGTINSISAPGFHDATTTTVITNTGNAPFTPTVLGADWFGTTFNDNSQAHMVVGRTDWTTVDFSHQALTTVESPIGYLLNYLDTKTVSYRLSIPTGLPLDTYHQTITFNGCA